MRGDAGEAAMLEQGVTLVNTLGIKSDLELGPIVDPAVPFDGDPVLLQRLTHMYDAGAWVLMESAIADLPADLRWLFESGAVTLPQLAAIYHTTGATAASDLRAAIEDGSLRLVPGIDDATENRIAETLPTLRSATPRTPLGRAITIADPILATLRDTPGIAWAMPAGSLRRAEETVGDIDIIASASDPADAIEALSHHPDAGRVLHRGDRRIYLTLDRVQLGVRFPDPARAGSALWRLTGSVTHVAAIVRMAKQRGVDITTAATEEELYARLDLPFIPAEIRDEGDEIAAARDGRLPALVSRAHIRGDLHMHTSFSDGRDTVEAMVTECHRLGYEYLAITDHSQSAGTSRALTVDGISQQAEEVAAMRARFPSMAIFHGCEVDIMPDGRLDFPDRLLEKFDIVLASLHDSAGHEPDRLEKRYVAAMKHPLVTIITHPTNRLLPHRRGYRLDWDRMFATAIETKTFMEVDGAPSHLDMDGALARRAIAAGVTVSIDSDSHRSEMLGRQMDLGVATARRGWVEPKHVVNARPAAELRALIKAKR